MLMLLISAPPPDEIKRLEEIKDYFEEAERVSGVSKDVLMAVSYALTKYYHHIPKEGEIPQYGIMGIFNLSEAERFSGINREKIINNPRDNIIAGAKLIRHYMEVCGGDLQCALRNYGPKGAENAFAMDVLKLLKNGLEYPVLSIKPHTEINIKDTEKSGFKPLACPPGPEYPLVDRWDQADPSNFTASSRPSSYPIHKIIVHTTEGSYYGAISWFKNPSSNVSAHYVLRSSDGEATQMVCHKDIAWHAGNWYYNTRSIGIEHEGYVSRNGWYTDTVLKKSAYISRMSITTFGFSLNHDTINGIMGHNEVPGATHTDPGAYWDWLYYMALVEGLRVSDTLVDNLTTGFRRGGPYEYWWFDSGNGYGTVYSLGNYRHTWYTYTTTGSVVNWARWTPNLPRTGLYEVKVYIPSGYNAYVRYRVYHQGSITDVWINQSLYSNQWVSLGTYTFDAGYSINNALTLGDTSDASGRKIAFDAAVWIYRGPSGCGDVVVDDGDPNWYPFGSWYLSSYSGYNGDYRYANVGGTPDSALWVSSLPCSGGWKVYAWVRKGTNRTTQAHYRIRTIHGDTSLYLNQYGSSSDTGWFYLGSVCADTFLVKLYDNAPDGSVVIADGIMFRRDTSISCYTDVSESEVEENIDIRFERGYINVLVPTRTDLTLKVFSADGRALVKEEYKGVRGWVKYPFKHRGVFFVVVEWKYGYKVKKFIP
ncbi:MAG: N-acetylmuramoyl-L-alanine amidase [candidate division WOR-3 bacterium]